MDFETEALEPAVMSGIVIPKGNRNERGPDELRNGDWWTNGYQNWDDVSFNKRLTHTTTGFLLTLSILLRYSSVARLYTQTNYLSLCVVQDT